ncbi:hypothetical protein LTR22_026841 [Elasticomyces elasticus]|nr:hypothetical protein LTR22_026841 [Elasticomyces elasticus]
MAGHECWELAWLNGPTTRPSVLVLTGKSGSGKTTVVSRAAHEAQASFAANQSQPPTTELIVAKAYCSYADAVSQQLKNVLGSWVAQIAGSLPSVLDGLDETIKNESVSVQQLEDRITGASVGDMKILLILDALNESVEHGAICQSITRLTWAASNIRCLVSGTSNPYGFLKEPCPFEEVHMATDDMVPDMMAYVERQREQSEVLRCIPLLRMLDVLLHQTDGMFRWLDCQMQYLATVPTVKMALRALDRLPGTLDDTYESMLLRVPESMRTLASEALMWLAFAHRPMTVGELNEAVVVEEGDQDIDDTCRLRPADVLLTLCQGLLHAEQATLTVTLAHHSVWTFLTSDRILASPASFAHLAEPDCMRATLRKCVAYLLMTPFAIGICRPDQFVHMQEAYPLLDYATTRWPLHAYMCSLGNDELDMIGKLLSDNEKFKFWISVLFPERGLELASIASPIYYAASYGLVEVVERFLQRRLVSSSPSAGIWFIDHKCGRATSTALGVAAYQGHSAVARVLLAAGADPNVTDSDGISCLSWAESSGDQETVDLFEGFMGERRMAAQICQAMAHEAGEPLLSELSLGGNNYVPVEMPRTRSVGSPHRPTPTQHTLSTTFLATHSGSSVATNTDTDHSIPAMEFIEHMTMEDYDHSNAALQRGRTRFKRQQNYQFSCPECSTIFTRQDTRDRHRQEQHLKDTPRMQWRYPCRTPKVDIRAVICSSCNAAILSAVSLSRSRRRPGHYTLSCIYLL